MCRAPIFFIAAIFLGESYAVANGYRPLDPTAVQLRQKIDAMATRAPDRIVGTKIIRHVSSAKPSGKQRKKDRAAENLVRFYSQKILPSINRIDETRQRLKCVEMQLEMGLFDDPLSHQALMDERERLSRRLTKLETDSELGRLMDHGRTLAEGFSGDIPEFLMNNDPTADAGEVPHGEPTIGQQVHELVHTARTNMADYFQDPQLRKLSDRLVPRHFADGRIRYDEAVASWRAKECLIDQALGRRMFATKKAEIDALGRSYSRAAQHTGGRYAEARIQEENLMPEPLRTVAGQLHYIEKFLADTDEVFFDWLEATRRRLNIPLDAFDRRAAVFLIPSPRVTAELKHYVTYSANQLPAIWLKLLEPIGLSLPTDGHTLLFDPYNRPRKGSITAFNALQTPIPSAWEARYEPDNDHSVNLYAADLPAVRRLNGIIKIGHASSHADVFEKTGHELVHAIELIHRRVERLEDDVMATTAYEETFSQMTHALLEHPDVLMRLQSIVSNRSAPEAVSRAVSTGKINRLFHTRLQAANSWAQIKLLNENYLDDSNSFARTAIRVRAEATRRVYGVDAPEEFRDLGLESFYPMSHMQLFSYLPALGAVNALLRAVGMDPTLTRPSANGTKVRALDWRKLFASGYRQEFPRQIIEFVNNDSPDVTIDPDDILKPDRLAADLTEPVKRYLEEN